MNLNDVLSPQTRSRVYLALGIIGLVLGAVGAGIGAFAASGFTAPLIVGAALSAVNAVYGFVAGAFGFVAKANTPDVFEYLEDVEDIEEDALLEDDEDDSGPVG